VAVWRSGRKAIAALLVVGIAWCAGAPLGSVAAAAPSMSAGADPARAAREVFQDPEFWWKRIEHRSLSTSWLETIIVPLLDFFDRILRRISELIARILRMLFGIFTGNATTGTLVVWLIALALSGFAIWRLGRIILRWLAGGAPAPDSPAAASWQALAAASDLLEQARASLRAGKYAESIRLALLAFIARLEKLGLVRYDTTRTNREYQMELRHRSELAACFGQVARIYERVWYGRAAAGYADAERAIFLSGSVINGEGLAPE
jgi:hypothetical protein